MNYVPFSKFDLYLKCRIYYIILCLFDPSDSTSKEFNWSPI